MPEFNLVRHPTISPTRCFLCHTHTGPMIDTFIDDRETNGRIYICAPNDQRSGCVAQMAIKCGFTLPTDTSALEERVEELEQELHDLRTREYTVTISGLEKSANTSTAKGFSLSQFMPTR